MEWIIIGVIAVICVVWYLWDTVALAIAVRDARRAEENEEEPRMHAGLIAFCCAID